MPKQSSPSVKITYFDKKRVRAALDRHVAAMVAHHPEIQRVGERNFFVRRALEEGVTLYDSSQPA